MRASKTIALAFALSFAVTHAAQAQRFPSKPVRWIVAFGAGGPGDELARVLGPALSDLWKQQVVIDNRLT